MGPASVSLESNKVKITAKVVLETRSLNPPVRFLEFDKASGRWNEIGDVRARKKASQSLRDDARVFCKAWEPEKLTICSPSPKISLETMEGKRKGCTHISSRKKQINHPPTPTDCTVESFVGSQEVIEAIQSQIDESTKMAVKLAAALEDVLFSL